MPLISNRSGLSQGASNNVTDAAWGTPTGNEVAITSAGANLPTISAGQFFAIRNHSNSQNNGLYQETGGTPSTSAITADKVSGADPVAAAAEAVDVLGTSADPPNIFYDTAGRGLYLLEDNGLDEDGVLGPAVYSKAMTDWKDDDFLMANAPFPMLVIDADAGKFIMGQDASGNTGGWNWVDVPAYGIRTRKLLRNIGWSEIDSGGIVQAIWPSGQAS